MRVMDQADKWEVDALARQVDASRERVERVEERLDQISGERFRNTMFLLGAGFVVAMAGLAFIAAQS